MTTLLDVNVLVALAWPNHVHHGLARRWFEKNHAAGWATCSTTENGFVRVSSNPKVVDEARSPAEAILLLQRLVDVEGHRWWLRFGCVADHDRLEHRGPRDPVA